MIKRKLINKRDILLFVLLICVAVLTWFIRSDSHGQAQAQININGQTVMIIDLSTDRRIVIESLPSVYFEVRDGAAAFIKSDCPDQICVQSGFLQRPGQIAACLPNRVSLTIISGVSEDVDMIAY